MTTIDFQPRAYQAQLIQYMFNGGCRGKRAVVVWHRRAGKDITLLNILINAALFDRVGTYYYLFPTYGQGKKIIWDGMDGDGQKFLSYIPPDAIAKDRYGKPKINETDMQVELANGSIIQIVGTDKIDSVVGTNPIGCLFSEYSLQKPQAWELLEPILAENGGWAAFAYTPRGHNHGFDLYEGAGREAGWYRQLLTVDDTKKLDGERVISAAYIESLKRRNVDEDVLQQEYYCSFNGSMQGSYYGQMMKAARIEGRVTVVPWIPKLPVETWWDLGRNDSNVIWFVQHDGRTVRFIDYYENRSQGLPHYIKLIREKDYTYNRHVMPHDINVTEYASNTKRIDVARSLGLKHIVVAPKLRLEEGFEAVRLLLPRSMWDEKKCRQGILALEEYSKEWNPEAKCFGETPIHNWASNPCDAIRTGAVAVRSMHDVPMQIKADAGFSVFQGEMQELADSTFNVLTV
jgi:phage terminase large subunit